MMLAQVQHQVAARHLPVERRVVVEAVIPINLEAEKALIELVGLATSKMRKIGTTLVNSMVIGSLPLIPDNYSALLPSPYGQASLLLPSPDCFSACPGARLIRRGAKESPMTAATPAPVPSDQISELATSAYITPIR